MSDDSSKGAHDPADVSGGGGPSGVRDPADVRTTIQVSRRYEAAPERVYDAWLDPTIASRFLFATPAGEMVRADIDPRVGGPFLLVDRRDGEDVAHVGEWLELARPSEGTAHRGRITFRFAVPKYSEERSEVAIDLAPDGAGCTLTLANASVPLEWADQTEQGWKAILDALAVALEGRTR